MVYFPRFTIIYYENQPFVQANIPYMDGMGWHGHGFTMFHISSHIFRMWRSNVEPPETNMEPKMDHWKGMFLSFLNSSIWGFQIPKHPCMSHLPGIEKQHPCHSYPIYKTFVASEHMWATEKKQQLLLSIKSWLVNRDPGCRIHGLWNNRHITNWVGFHLLKWNVHWINPSTSHMYLNRLSIQDLRHWRLEPRLLDILNPTPQWKVKVNG